MKTSSSTVRILGALTVFLLALCLLPAGSTARAETTSGTLQSRIEQKLQAEKLQNILVTVSDGNVVLEGTVPTLAAKLHAERVAAETKGITRVTNKITLEESHRADQQIAADVAKSISTYFYYGAFDWVSGTINNGTVTLTGWARQPWHKEDYEKRIQEIPGVQQVVNQISVLPVSIYDERLRVRVAALIYHHPILSRYRIGAYPDIHIIVENGRVTLEGAVGSEAAQTVARMLAQRSNAFTVTNKLQVVPGT